MYDTSVLKTTKECRTVMERAKKIGNDDFYRKVFAAIARLSTPKMAIQATL